LPNANLNTAQRQESEAPVETAAMLGAQVLSLLPALRLHSVSLFDAQGDVQWLSEGALGPDEQGVVEEAIATLSAATSRAHLQSSLPDSRAALFLAVRTPRATLAGVIMVLMDAKLLSSGNLAARILTTGMRSVLQKIAMLLVPPPPSAATATFAGIRAFSTGTVPLEMAMVRGAGLADTANCTPAEPPKVATPEDVRALEILEPPAGADPAGANDLLAWDAPEVAESAESAEIAFDAEPAIPQTTDEVQALPSPPANAGASSDLDVPVLRLRELIRLRAGGRTRRYQVVPVAELQRGDALTTLNQLLTWLRHNPQVLQGDPLSFTIGVSARALSDAELPAALARALASAALEPGIIGFELREAACINHFSLAENFIAQCEQSRCFIVIDDFTFNTAMLELLRSSAVRLLKVDARLVTAALRDKLAQARVVAIAQAAKVLGTLCAAKYVDSQSGRRWLAAVGFDFNQSSVTESLQRLAVGQIRQTDRLPSAT
jgi:EAL domain-containing protein (putative c-di-GMP-specific phosphodiesterase class I)